MSQDTPRYDAFTNRARSYELSIDVGSNLETQLDEADCEHTLASGMSCADCEHTLASGMSCADQIGDLVGDEPMHVVELIAPD